MTKSFTWFSSFNPHKMRGVNSIILILLIRKWCSQVYVTNMWCSCEVLACKQWLYICALSHTVLVAGASGRLWTKCSRLDGPRERRQDWRGHSNKSPRGYSEKNVYLLSFLSWYLKCFNYFPGLVSAVSMGFRAIVSLSGTFVQIEKRGAWWGWGEAEWAVF